MGTILPSSASVPGGGYCSGRARPILLAVLVASTITACGLEPWPERPGRAAASALSEESSDVPAPSPQPTPAETFPLEPADIERKARKSRSAATARKTKRDDKAAPPIEEPELVPPEGGEVPVLEAAPAAEWVDPLAIEEVAPPDLMPGLPPAAEASGHPATLIVVASCSLLGALVLWRRRRARQRRSRREAWTPIRWGGPKLLRPHWEYDPGRYDSDDFLRRWDSIGLSISGEWGLLLAIAGHAIPLGFRVSAWQPAPRQRLPMTVRPIWQYAPFAGDEAQHLARWCRLGLGIHGDPLAASIVRGEYEWVFDIGDAPAEVPAQPVLPLAEPMPEVPPEDSEVDVALESHPPAFAACEAALPADDIAVVPVRDMEVETSPVPPIEAQPMLQAAEVAPGSSSPAIEGAVPIVPAVAVAPPEEHSGTGWLAGVAALLQAWDGGAVEAEPALWEVSRRLRAHAQALPPAARTPWLDAAEALAERVAVHAPETSRGAWQAHWVDLRLARLSAMNGAWRLLELRALHDACAGYTGDEVVEAKIRLLNAWAGALLGPAAKAKRAEAAALAALLHPAQALRA